MLTEYSDNLIGQLMDWRGVCSSADALPVVKRELSMKAKLSIYRLVYIPTLAYDDELWLVIKRTRSQIQTVKISSGEWPGSALAIAARSFLRNSE